MLINTDSLKASDANLWLRWVSCKLEDVVKNRLLKCVTVVVHTFSSFTAAAYAVAVVRLSGCSS